MIQPHKIPLAAGLVLVAFLPTHLALRRIFAVSLPAAGLKLPIRFL
jgi:hypothetical protein